MMPLNFSAEEALAILAALPLVDVLGANSEAQRRRNLELCLSVSKKLVELVDGGMRGSQSRSSAKSLMPISANELRVCLAAVHAAKLYFSGFPLSLDSDLKQDLEQYREVYPPLFERLSESSAPFAP